MSAIGADWANAARGFMFAVGCAAALVQHQPLPVRRRHPGQLAGRTGGPDKAERVYNFHRLPCARSEMLAAAGLKHPDELTPHHLVRRINATEIALSSARLHPS